MPITARSYLPALIAATIVAAASCRREPWIPHERIDGLTYGSDPKQTITLLVPEGHGPFPTLIWIHGGGWNAGSPAETAQVFDLVHHGYLIASVGYRFAVRSRFPAQLHDVKAAVRFLRAHAGRLKIDPERMGAMGWSAGGHLAALLGTSHGVPGLEDPASGNERFPASVRAFVSFSGPTDLSRMDEMGRARGCAKSFLYHDKPTSPESKLLGCGVRVCADKVVAANPAAHVSPDDAAAYLVTGARDCWVAPEQSLLLHESLVRSGVESHFEIVEGASHDLDETYARDVKSRVVAFLDRVVKGVAMADGGR